MTYVEFFDKSDVENIGACLTNPPKRVVLIGNNKATMDEHIERYQTIFQKRKQQVEFLTELVSKRNLGKAIEVLTRIVEQYDDCVFDITGGEEVLCMALGIVFEQVKREKNRTLQIQKFDVKEGNTYDCDGDGASIFRERPMLSVQELIKLHGGDIVFDAADKESYTYRWDLTEEFKKDIEAIWSVCKANVRAWNLTIGWMKYANEIKEKGTDPFTITVRLDAMAQKLKEEKSRYSVQPATKSALQRLGLITAFSYTDTEVRITFKNEQVMKCLIKEGQALEMHIFLTAKSLQTATGEPVYYDVMNGVYIDWDGEIHKEKDKEKQDTKNEMDVILMQGLIPVFISCKNGNIEMEELYKLHTVASRFGGSYVKKVLVATSLQDSTKKGRQILQRAKDMGIRVVYNVQTFSPEQMRKTMRNLWAYTQ